MNDLGYNIASLFASSFGLNVSKGFNPKAGNGRPDDPKGIYQGIEFVDQEEALHLSELGTPVLFPITLLASTYRRYNDIGKIEEVTMEEFQLPISCVVDFRLPKIMAKTNVSGGKGTVKELFGFDDWQIAIKGFFLKEGNQPQGLTHPLEQEKRLTEWCELACSVEVAGELFNMRDINSIALGELAINAERGRPGIRPFTLPCLSDDPVELQIDNSNPSL